MEALAERSVERYVHINVRENDGARRTHRSAFQLQICDAVCIEVVPAEDELKQIANQFHLAVVEECVCFVQELPNSGDAVGDWNRGVQRVHVCGGEQAVAVADRGRFEAGDELATVSEYGRDVLADQRLEDVIESGRSRRCDKRVRRHDRSASRGRFVEFW